MLRFLSYIIIITLLSITSAHAFTCSEPQKMINRLHEDRFYILSTAQVRSGLIFTFIDNSGNYKIIGIDRGIACVLLEGNNWKFIRRGRA